MPSSFPNPERIIEELNECRSYIGDGKNPRRGEVDAANYIMEFARRWGLGDVQRFPLPEGSKFDNFRSQDAGLSNIVIDRGSGKDERLFLHGHFDVVPPTEYGSPDQARLMQDRHNKHIYKGLGSYDMLSGVAAILTSMHNMRVATHRSVRAVLVFGEENDSEGTHAAFDQGLFAFDGNKYALSTEITVGATINDPYHIVVGRPGRFALNVALYGTAMHAGDVTDENTPSLTRARSNRMTDMLMAYKEFNPHPADMTKILHPGRITIGESNSRRPRSLSTAGKEMIELDVHYADPNMTIAAMHAAISGAIEKTLGDGNFELTQPRRDMPWTPPWLEELDGSNPFPLHVRRIAEQTVPSRSRQKQVLFRTGKGVADENIIAAHDIPVVALPPKGEGAHTKNECVNIRSVEDFQVPTMRDAAAYAQSLGQNIDL